MNNIKIILADDHQILRDGIKYLLQDEPGIEIVGQVSNGEELLQMLPHTPADLVLLDLNMPAMDGFQTLEHLHGLFPSVRVLVLSMVAPEKHIVRLMEMGALGYVLKTVGKDELVHAIRKVANGQVYIGTDITMSLLKRTQPKAVRVESDAGGMPVDLSKREVEVLELISEGYSNHEIAEKLCVSKRTIDSHRQNLMEKTRVKNTAALIKFALVKGIIS